ncbi:MAG: hypothetical protein RSD22_06125 [Romboutsia sp.]
MSKWIQNLNEKIILNILFKYEIGIHYFKDNIQLYCIPEEVGVHPEHQIVFKTKDAEIALSIYEDDYIIEEDSEKITIKFNEYLHMYLFDAKKSDFQNACCEVDTTTLNESDIYSKQDWEHSFTNALAIYNDYFNDGTKVGVSQVENTSYLRIIPKLFSSIKNLKGLVEIIEPNLNIRVVNLSFTKSTYNHYIDLEVKAKLCSLRISEPNEVFQDLIVNYANCSPNELVSLRFSKNFMVHFPNSSLDFYNYLLNFQKSVRDASRQSSEADREYRRSLSSLETESLDNWYDK